MIDNIVLLITGTLHQRSISELIPKCHPLGSFEQMEAIHIASNAAELYNAVLVDTPLGNIKFWYEEDNILILFWIFLAPYFIDCISEQDLDEMNIEIIRNTLYKVSLNDHHFSKFIVKHEQIKGNSCRRYLWFISSFLCKNAYQCF